MTTYHSNRTQDQSSAPAQAGLRVKVRAQVEARMKDDAKAKALLQSDSLKGAAGLVTEDRWVWK